MSDAMNGLTNAQEQQMAALYKARYLALGALDAQIISATSLSLGYSCRVGVITTPSDVLLAFEGVSHSIQFARTFASFSSLSSLQLFGHTTSVWSAYIPGLLAVKPQLDAAVAEALQRTRDPTAAKIFLSGHSTGAARAAIYALVLLDQPEPPAAIGAVYSFGSAMLGQDCSEPLRTAGAAALAAATKWRGRAVQQRPAGGDTACFVQLYTSKLGDRTFRWVHELDIAATLPWPAGSLDGSIVAPTDSSGQPSYRWGHVPQAAVYRVVRGVAMGPLSGEAALNCPKMLLGLSSTSGSSNNGTEPAPNTCDFNLRDHMSGNYVLALRGVVVKYLSTANKAELNWPCTTEALISKALVKPP